MKDQEAIPGQERRKHKRFRVRNKAFAMLCWHCDVLGRILDIGRGGLAFRYLATEKRSDRASLLNILLTDQTASVNKLPYECVWDRPAPEEFQTATITFRHCGVRFGQLRADQELELETFIQNHIRGGLTNRSASSDSLGKRREARMQLA